MNMVKYPPAPLIERVEQMSLKVHMDDGTDKMLIFNIKNGYVNKDETTLEFITDTMSNSKAILSFNLIGYDLTVLDAK